MKRPTGVADDAAAVLEAGRVDPDTIKQRKALIGNQSGKANGNRGARMAPLD